MRSLSRCSSLVLLVSLVLLCLSQCSATPLPTGGPPHLGLALLHLQDLLDQLHGPNRRQQREQYLDQGTDSDQDHELLNSLEAFPTWDQSDPSPNQDWKWRLARSEHQDLQRDLDDDGRLSEALSAVAGGLQAISREKGGIGFRFGRKRTTAVQDRSRPDPDQN